MHFYLPIITSKNIAIIPWYISLKKPYFNLDKKSINKNRLRNTSISCPRNGYIYLTLSDPGFLRSM